MNLDAIEHAMIHDLGLPSQSATRNQLVLLQKQYPKSKGPIIRVLNRYLDLCRRFREGEILRPAANKIIREQYMPEILKEDPDDAILEKPAPISDDSLNPFNGPTEFKKFTDVKDGLVKQVSEDGTVFSFAPIIPLTTPSLVPQQLERKGIPYSVFAKYVILDRQMVIGISHKELEKRSGAFALFRQGFRDIQESGKQLNKLSKNRVAYLQGAKDLRAMALGITSQLDGVAEMQVMDRKIRNVQVSVKDNGSAEEVVHLVAELGTRMREYMENHESSVSEDAVMDQLMRRAGKVVGKKLSLVARSINYAGAKWAWVASDKEISMIMSCGFANHCAIEKWGFAFSN